MSIKKENYVVYVKETSTRKYYVNATSEQEAEETYKTEGVTSIIFDKDIDREVIFVGLASKEDD